MTISQHLLDAQRALALAEERENLKSQVERLLFDLGVRKMETHPGITDANFPGVDADVSAEGVSGEWLIMPPSMVINELRRRKLKPCRLDRGLAGAAAQHQAGKLMAMTPWVILGQTYRRSDGKEEYKEYVVVLTSHGGILQATLMDSQSGWGVHTFFAAEPI